MITLINIRLIKIRSKPWSNLFNFGYPILFLMFSFNIFFFSDESEEIFQPINYNFYKERLSFSGNLAIIAKNDSIATKAKTFFQLKTVCSDVQEFRSPRDMQEYEKRMSFQFNRIWEIKGDNVSDLSFVAKSSELNVNWFDSTVNQLSVIPLSVYDSANTAHAIEFQEVISALTLYLNNHEITHKLQVQTMKLHNMEINNTFANRWWGTLFSSLLALSFSATLFHFVLWIVEEKEKKLKDYWNRHGISHLCYCFSWFWTYLIWTAPSVITSIWVIKAKILKNTNVFLILWFWYPFLFNMFALAFFFSSLVSTVSTAETLFKIIYFGMTVLSFIILQPGVSVVLKIFFSFFPQINLCMSIELLSLLDNYKGWDLELVLASHNGISFLTLLILYVFVFAVYLIISFFSYSFNNSGVDFVTFVCSLFSKAHRVIDYTKIQSPETNFVINHEEHSEKNSKLKLSGQCLEIKHVQRRYGNWLAVNDFTGEWFENEIFCLLGHNGAGKTTLIKMLSGTEDPDEGDIFLNNTSIVTDKKFLFTSIGLCSQDDIFFDYLTVEEHLSLMCDIKGSKANINEINTLLEKIDLIDKKKSITKTLSGGQKRKLCIAWAMIGNSKLILWDEPTSGMDVIAKRALWEFWKDYKRDRIIILTTHSLDEAEYLGDRIGIMTEGKFVCSGTSSYLKGKYPCGYNVNWIINGAVFTMEEQNILLEKMKSIDRTSTVKVASKTILSINFETWNESVHQVFGVLKEWKRENKIEDYTISTTSLEDVFLKLNSNELSKQWYNQQNIKPELKCENRGDDFEGGLNPKINGKSVIVDYDEFWQGNTSSLCSEFNGNVKRGMISLWRNKLNFAYELFSSSAALFIYIIGFGQLFPRKTNSSQTMDDILTYSNDIYLGFAPENKVFTYDNLMNSHYISKRLKGKIHFKKWNITSDLTPEQFDDLIYTSKKHKNVKSGIYFSEGEETHEWIVYNLFRESSPDYYIATMNFVLSFFMRSITGSHQSQLKATQVSESNQTALKRNT